MKYKSFLIILSIISLGLLVKNSNAQSGEIRFLVKHKWTKKIAAVEYMSKARREHYEYVWGNVAEYEEKSVLYYNSNAYRYEDVEDQSEYVGHSWRTSEYFIYRDLKQNTTYDVMRMLNKLYVIQDTIRYQNWKMLNDMKEIAGHICMNASYTDTIKDNDIVAWFALDLPISIGPERFGGLPGMILEIDINNGAMVITAEEIIEYESDTIIEKPTHKKRIRQINEDEYNQLLIDYMDECIKEERPYFWGLRY